MCVLNELERRKMPVAGLLTTLTQMSTHRSGIQEQKVLGGGGGGGHPCPWITFLPRVRHYLFPQQEQNKSPTQSACVEDSPQSTPTASVRGLHLPFPVIWSHCVWGQDSGRDIKVVIKMEGQKEKESRE